MSSKRKIAVIGTVGVPANYGGFETLAENLVAYHSNESLPSSLTVYCSGKSYPNKQHSYRSASLKYVPLHANGVQSIPYDIWSLISAIWNRHDVLLLLGVSGAIALPVLRLFTSARVITNIDGIEWRRAKWKGLAKKFLRFSERMAVRFSDEVVADNAAIAEYVKDAYGVDTHVIAYGGDHVLSVDEAEEVGFDLPEYYAVSICRIEPENNIGLILEAFSRQKRYPLVLVGNWNSSEYGRRLREQYGSIPHLYLQEPIYDLAVLRRLRGRATLYVHGHSAGGTNPSLVEAMHFGLPIIAYDCSFNRYTTEGQCAYFDSAASMLARLDELEPDDARRMGASMFEIANRRYTWRTVAKQYFDLLD